jgi:hypothetical protein
MLYRYKSKSDGFLALNLSLSLTLLFIACNYYKLSTLTELDNMQALTHPCDHPSSLPAHTMP